MKIIFIITGLSTGGAETMLLKLLERLDSRFSPHVISLTSLGEIGPRIQALGIPVEALGMKPGVIPNPLAVARLVRRLKVLKPEIVHTWMSHADLLGGLAARLTGVPATAWNVRHSNLPRDKSKWSTRALGHLCALISHWVPDQIVCNSQAGRSVHINMGYDSERFVIIPNGFDLSRFYPNPTARHVVRLELGLPEAVPLIGLIARFDPLKNHEGFLEATGLLHRQRPDVHFLLVGAGVEKSNPAIREWVQRYGVAGVTHLLGFRQDIPRLIAALDIVSSSSYSEAFPNVIGEAMACGVPCVVTDVGDSAYIVGDTGRVVPSGDRTGLATAWEQLLTLPDSERRSLGERARARVAEHFQIGAVVKQYEAFYEELGKRSFMKNADKKTVDGFGKEWSSFDQSGLSTADRTKMFDDYFHIFPWQDLPEHPIGADIGCGSGRWAYLTASRSAILHCIDPSKEALAVARRNLAAFDNIQFHQASVSELPFPDASLDFAYALGVFHHVPDTAAAIANVAVKLKPGAPFLIYLYYAFDNRPTWFRLLWRTSDLTRRFITKLPYPIRYLFSQFLAIIIYWPLARLAAGLERLGRLPLNWPLAYYRDKEFYVMRTDALDRFGTCLEQRFTKPQISAMLESAGFVHIQFSDRAPYWCAVAKRRV